MLVNGQRVGEQHVLGGLRSNVLDRDGVGQNLSGVETPLRGYLVDLERCARELIGPDVVAQVGRAGFAVDVVAQAGVHAGVYRI